LGCYADAAGNGHGFLLDQGRYTTVDPPDSSSGTSANGINNAGQIVGWYTDAAGHGHGYLLDQGSYTTLDVPGPPSAINASGQIVGS
jgi:probable HAF family extracellular repeat protein